VQQLKDDTATMERVRLSHPFMLSGTILTFQLSS
jgi:hypothetical protein